MYRKKKKKFPAVSLILVTLSLCLLFYCNSAGYLPKDSAPSKIMTKLTTSVTSKISPKKKDNNSTNSEVINTQNDATVINSSSASENSSSSDNNSNSDSNTSGKKVLNSSLRNVVYTYGLGSVKTPEKYTHIILAFIYTDSTGKLSNDFSSTAADIKNFKKAHPNVEVLAAVTGTGAKAALTTAMQNATTRDTLAQNLADFAAKYGLDGIDLDWEFYNNYSTNNKAYRSLAETLRSHLGNDKTLSMAGQSSSNFYSSSDIVSVIQNTMDFVSVMNYDYDTATAKDNKVAYTGYFTQAKEVLNGYAKAVGSNYTYKINIGLPFYGLKFKVNSTSIYKRGEAVTDFVSKYRYNLIASEIDLSLVKYTDNNGVAYYNDGKTLYTFDDPTTINTKIKYVADNNLGGAMAWVASHDTNETLQNAVVDALNTYAPK